MYVRQGVRTSGVETSNSRRRVVSTRIGSTTGFGFEEEGLRGRKGSTRRTTDLTLHLLEARNTHSKLSAIRPAQLEGEGAIPALAAERAANKVVRVAGVSVGVLVQFSRQFKRETSTSLKESF